MIDRPLAPTFEGTQVTVSEWLEGQVELLQQAYAAHDPLALWVLRGTGRAKGTDGELWAAGLTAEQAREAMAVDHSYKNWADAASHADDAVDTRFEAACDAIQAGDVVALSRMLDDEPGLIRQRSPFPHRAMLLHYVAANGVEVERQIESPANAVEVMHLLLERGADADADCTIYGDGQTTMCLLVSSAGPAKAGVMAPLVEELCRGGANPDGPANDGMPLWTAISFGYTKAAEALARCGARVNNIVFAAALGDLNAVRGQLDEAGRPIADFGRLPREHLIDYAFLYAAGHDRRDVVEFLLAKGPDLTVRDPIFGATAAEYARYIGNTDVATLIDQYQTLHRSD